MTRKFNVEELNECVESSITMHFHWLPCKAHDICSFTWRTCSELTCWVSTHCFCILLLLRILYNKIRIRSGYGKRNTSMKMSANWGEAKAFVAGVSFPISTRPRFLLYLYSWYTCIFFPRMLKQERRGMMQHLHYIQSWLVYMIVCIVMYNVMPCTWLYV